MRATTRGGNLPVAKWCDGPLQSARMPCLVLPYCPWELELELIQSHMAQKQVLRGEVGCACVAREVSVHGAGAGVR